MRGHGVTNLPVPKQVTGGFQLNLPQGVDPGTRLHAAPGRWWPCWRPSCCWRRHATGADHRAVRAAHRVRAGHRLQRPRWPTPPACATTGCRTTPTPAATGRSRRATPGISGSAPRSSRPSASLSGPVPGLLVGAMPADRRLLTGRSAGVAGPDAGLRYVHALPRDIELARPHRRFPGTPWLQGACSRHSPGSQTDHTANQICHHLLPRGVGVLGAP
jgi:hypothetical protein